MTGFIRRVVTGHDQDGKSTVIADGLAPVVNRNRTLRSDRRTTDIWKTTATPAPISREEPDPTLAPGEFVPPMGTKVRINEIAPEPDAVRNLSPDEARKYYALHGNDKAAEFPGVGRQALMHRTETIDYAIVLDGEITLFLETGHVVLKTGDVLIQRGTNHAWSNRSDRPARMLFVLIDGRFDPELAALLSKPAEDTKSASVEGVAKVSN